MQPEEKSAGTLDRRCRLQVLAVGDEEGIPDRRREGTAEFRLE